VQLGSSHYSQLVEWIAVALSRVRIIFTCPVSRVGTVSRFCWFLAEMFAVDVFESNDDVTGSWRRDCPMINLGSALLVAGVLQMQAWLRLPIVFVDDAKLAIAMNDWSLALTTFIGCVFSLMIACIYICCAKVLSKWAEAKLRQLPVDALDFSLEDWLKNTGSRLNRHSGFRKSWLYLRHYWRGW